MHNKWVYNHLLQKRSRRKRRLKAKKGRKRFREYAAFKYQQRLKALYPLVINELQRCGYIEEEQAKLRVKIPRFFSFKKDYEGCITFFKELLSSYVYSKSVEIDFEKCEETSISAFTIFDLLLKELGGITRRYNEGLYYTTQKSVKIKRSLKDKKTNKYLHAFQYVSISEEESDDSYFLPLRLHRGKGRNSYTENRKSTTCRYIIEFINESFHGSNVELNIKGINAIEGLITEVLSNAEDHSINNSEWYVNGISFLEIQHNTQVVELNLAIMNIGPSMYEGFEQTKQENEQNYKKVEKIYKGHVQQFTPKNRFERESLFMLYMLNEGISRLKYLESSRGNGTMNFIESFITLGSFGGENPQFNAQLNIASGHTILTCDNRYKPFEEGNFKKLSLNSENTLTKLPDRDYLKYHQACFPGTILECRIYLNSEFFTKILNENENR